MKKIKSMLTFLILLFLATVVFGESFLKVTLFPLKYEDQVVKCSHEYGIDPALTMGVIKAESGFHNDAVSHKDAHGLMQITPDTFSWAKEKMKGPESFEDIYEPDVNIRYGTFILSYLIEDFGNVETALAAYNAGRGQVQKWLSDENYSKDGKTLYDIPFKETREYVEKVLNNRDNYKKLYPDELA